MIFVVGIIPEIRSHGLGADAVLSYLEKIVLMVFVIAALAYEMFSVGSVYIDLMMVLEQMM